MIQWSKVENQIKQQLEELTGHVRKVTPNDVAYMTSAIRAAVKRAKAEGILDVVRIEARVRGGFVPNNYAWKAECDEVTMVLTYEDGRPSKLDGRAHRTAAQHRARGAGNRAVIRRVREGQTQGTIVEVW